jgi:hypothetical protein
MKIYATFALIAFQAASGFVIQTPATRTFALASSRDSSTLTNTNRLEDASRTQPAMRGSSNAKVRESYDTAPKVTVQGGSLRTWSLTDPFVESVEVMLKTEGRPLNANVELWQGPDNTPQKMGVYIEDGSLRPFNCIIKTPRAQNAIAVRNTGNLEFPLAASVEADVDGAYDEELALATGKILQGGAVATTPFNPSVASVQIVLKTDGRPLNARIELLQGPNNNKQILEVYTEDGMERPFIAIIKTPGAGNVVRIVNTATMEFPITSSVEPYEIDENASQFMVN